MSRRSVRLASGGRFLEEARGRTEALTPTLLHTSRGIFGGSHHGQNVGSSVNTSYLMTPFP